jgi:hypothetical protein
LEHEFDEYQSYLTGLFGNDYADRDTDTYHKYYAWLLGKEGNVGIEAGFSYQSMSVPPPISVPIIPPDTLYVLIAIY